VGEKPATPAVCTILATFNGIELNCCHGVEWRVGVLMRVPGGHISFSPPVLPVFPATGIFHHLQIEIRAVHFCFEACLPKKARRKHLGRFFDDWAGLCHLMKRRQDIK